ncbi:hypothetical protein [Paracoccus sp. JM45]|uniref:hypothetical protein n=1 Tax=Paracoccus sp. JM45 TaxID=2283626 RepID=UPI000E6BD917|nr:hypothetical protein [Paracoccus sp. JM45]RJE81580.1 hypothetical protein DWB67_02835 [Paracoccus sp. JM45]
MTKILEAAIIGDSHAKVIALAAEESGILFRKVMTASFQNYVDATLEYSAADGLKFQMSEFNRQKDLRADETKNNRVAHRAKNLTTTLNQIVNLKLPVYVNVGMTAVYFVRSLIVAAKENGQDPGLISRKVAQAAAEEHFESYARFYESLVQHVPDVTCFYGPTRFTPDMRHVWLAYDDVAAKRLSQIGIEIIDLRAKLGDDGLLLDPRYYRTTDDDQVHGNADWGLSVINGIQQDFLSKYPE